MSQDSDRAYKLKFQIQELEQQDQQDLAELEKLLVELEYVESEENLYSYLVAGWEYFDPAPFMSNWHLEAICEHVQACFEGQIRDLLITIPPRCCKSSIVSVAFPTWAWGPAKKPDTKFITASYGASLATRDSVRSRRLLQHPWFKRRWGNQFQLAYDGNLKTRYENNKGGFRLATSIGGVGTGEGFDVLAVDDPLKADDSESEAKLEEEIEWWQGTVSTRANNPKTARRIVECQRLNERDLAGHVLEEGGFVHLNLPMEYEPTIWMSPLNWRDPRTKTNELLWPERFNEDAVEKLKKQLGPYQAAAQLQQRPAPKGGGIIKEEWLRYWATPLPSYDIVIQSWDLSVDDTDGASFTVGQVWGKRDADRFLLDQVRDRMDINDQVRAILAMSDKYPQARTVLIEAKANGPAIIKMLNRQISGLTPIDPKDYGGSKTARLEACVPEWASGNVYLPLPSLHPWVKDFIKRILIFPKCAFKDEIDTCSQALNWLAEKGRSYATRDVKEQPFSRDATQNIFSGTNVGVRNSNKVIRGFFC